MADMKRYEILYGGDHYTQTADYFLVMENRYWFYKDNTGMKKLVTDESHWGPPIRTLVVLPDEVVAVYPGESVVRKLD